MVSVFFIWKFDASDWLNLLPHQVIEYYVIIFDLEVNRSNHFYSKGLLILILMELSYFFKGCVSQPLYLKRSSYCFFNRNFIHFVVHHKDDMNYVESKQD